MFACLLALFRPHPPASNTHFGAKTRGKRKHKEQIRLNTRDKRKHKEHKTSFGNGNHIRRVLAACGNQIRRFTESNSVVKNVAEFDSLFLLFCFCSEQQFLKLLPSISAEGSLSSAPTCGLKTWCKCNPACHRRSPARVMPCDRTQHTDPIPIRTTQQRTSTKHSLFLSLRPTPARGHLQQHRQTLPVQQSGPFNRILRNHRSGNAPALSALLHRTSNVNGVKRSQPWSSARHDTYSLSVVFKGVAPRP